MDYHDTYSSEIFRASQCLEREETISRIIRSVLLDHGYEVSAAGKDIYHRGNARVILSLVDDIEHVNYQHLEDLWQDITEEDIIVTDNYITRPTSARVVMLPKTWFGIYAHEPEIFVSRPTSAFSMPVNRIDANRVLILLRMQWNRLVDRGYVNFNCADHSTDQDQRSRIALWHQCCDTLREYHGNKYDRVMQELTHKMPLRNHVWDLDTMIQHGALHLVIETYASDVCVSFSEKIFRALQTPRPWMLFAGTWSVSRLQSLGFDTLSDVVDHAALDWRRMNDDKVTHFVDAVQKFIDGPSLDDHVQSRAHEAAVHNQALLHTWRRKWWRDLPVFLDELTATLETI